MIEEKRIKEAESNVRNYLEEGLIKKAGLVDKLILKIIVNNYKESLKVANLLFENKHSHLWTIVCSYYAMFYIANAVLYKLGYKVEHKVPHKVTADALIVFVKNKLRKGLLEEYEEAKEEALELAGLKADELIKLYDWEREKRSTFQYSFTEEVKEAKAKTSLERAKKFIFEMEKVLEGL